MNLEKYLQITKIVIDNDIDLIILFSLALIPHYSYPLPSTLLLFFFFVHSLTKPAHSNANSETSDTLSVANVNNEANMPIDRSASI